jgi:hypothetical protein
VVVAFVIEYFGTICVDTKQLLYICRCDLEAALNKNFAKLFISNQMFVVFDLNKSLLE